MKKWIALLLALMLCTLGCSAMAQEYNANGIFTITYDDTTYLMDNESYLEENSEDYLWMFLLYREDLDVVVDVARELVPEYEGLSLLSATADERAAYVESTLDAFVDANIKLLDTITVSEYDIPFYVYSLEDEDGAYITAETVVSGWAINFSAYHTDSAEADDSLLTALEELLTTFTPVTE